MKTLADKPQSIMQNILDIFHFYPAIMKSTWILIVLTSLMHIPYPFLLKINTYIGLSFVLLCVLLVWFLFAAILYRSFYALKNQAVSYELVWKHARRRFIAILAGNVIFILLFLFAIFIEIALIQAAELIHIDKEIAIFAGVLNLFIFILIYFAVPLIILDSSAVFAAFEKSAKLVWGSWWRCFIPAAFFFIILLAINSIGVLITGHSRMVLFTLGMFLINVFFYPVIVGYTLVLLNDIKLRQELKKNVSTT